MSFTAATAAFASSRASRAVSRDFTQSCVSVVAIDRTWSSSAFSAPDWASDCFASPSTSRIWARISSRVARSFFSVSSAACVCSACDERCCTPSRYL